MQVLNGLRFRAAVFKGPGELAIKEVEVPALREGEVLVRVSACGICGSDLNIFHRDPPIPKFWAGHEISGTVAETGPGVETLSSGDRVSVSPLIPCGECEECTEGRENVCQRCLFISYNLPGGFAEHLVVPEKNLHKIPDSTPLDTAVLVEPLADVFHAFDVAGGVEGRSVVVLGCGTIGLLTVAAASALGAEKVIAVGKYPHQRRLAEGLGAHSAFDSSVEGLAESVKEKLGRKADLAFETVGGYGSTSITDAIEYLRPGGMMILSGVHYKTPEMNLKNLTEREVVLKGTQRYRQNDFRAACELLCSGRLELTGLVTHRVPLEDISRGYETAFNKDEFEAVKVVVCP